MVTNLDNETCVTLNSMQSVTNWAINATTSPIYIYPIAVPPFLKYKEWEIRSRKQ